MKEEYVDELDDTLDDVEPVVDNPAELYEHFRVVVDKGQSQVRVDKYLFERLVNSSRNRIQKAADAGLIMANGKPVKSSYKVKPCDVLTVMMDRPRYDNDIIPEDIPLDIVYEDNDLMVVNKPAGLVVHPGCGNYHGTLVNALLAHCGDSLSGINGVARPGIVHRIDKDTSGLLIVAKNDFSHTRLAEQIQAHTFTREYSAVVYGSFKEDSGTVDQPLGRHPTDRKKIAVLPNSPSARRAVTHFWVVKRFQGFTQLRLRLETGRTHQIRVHMAYLGHPVAGDPVYGPKKSITSLEGQCLHAGKIGFVHPRTGEYLEFEAPLPAYFTGFLQKLKEV